MDTVLVRWVVCSESKIAARNKATTHERWFGISRAMTLALDSMIAYPFACR